MPAMPTVRMSAKEGVIAIAGGLALAAGLVTWLRTGAGGADPTSVAIVAPSTVLPAMSPPPPATPAQPVAPTAPAASIDGLVLYGVLGGPGSAGSAIIGYAGTQRLVRVGRDVAPGIRLRGVTVAAAVLEQDGAVYHLALADPSGRSSSRSVGTAPSAAGAADSSGQASAYVPRDSATETREFRLGLVPRTENGANTGYAVRPDNAVPIFTRAGLRPGDVITSVNGRAFTSEAEMAGLSREIAASATLVVGYQRGGKTKETHVPIQR